MKEVQSLQQAKKNDELESQLNELQDNYKQLLNSFDQSEELRRIYYQLVKDQRVEIQRLQEINRMRNPNPLLPANNSYLTNS